MADKDSAATPIAAHPRHDHGAARPVFLHVGCSAIPHRIAAGIIPGIDAVGFQFVIRIDSQACRRPSDTALRGRLGDGGLRRLRPPPTPWRGLRPGPRSRQHTHPPPNPPSSTPPPPPPPP